MEARLGMPGIVRCAAALLLSLAALLLIAAPARAGDTAAECPTIHDKPDAIAHVDYNGIQHLTYCYGPVSVKPGQNIIRLNPATDPDGTKLFPQVPGYITRFDPELIYADGRVPPVDVLHLHHAVWLIGSCSNPLFGTTPQYAVGEEKTIQQLPQGFGWRSDPSQCWYLNDMLHDLVAQAAQVYVVWRLDFVPDTAPDAPSIKPVTTSGWTSPGTRAFTRSSTPCAPTARTAATPSPTRPRRPTASPARCSAARRNPTAVSAAPRPGPTTSATP